MGLRSQRGGGCLRGFGRVSHRLRWSGFLLVRMWLSRMALLGVYQAADTQKGPQSADHSAVDLDAGKHVPLSTMFILTRQADYGPCLCSMCAVATTADRQAWQRRGDRHGARRLDGPAGLPREYDIDRSQLH